MKKSLKAYGLILLFFVVMSAVVFRCAWGADQVFSGSDSNIGLVNRQKNLLPDRFFGAFTTAPLIGDSSSSVITVSDIGRILLSPEMYADCWYAFYLIASSLALISYLRLWNLRWLSCVFGALSSFWVGSITLAAAGHMQKLGVMALFSMGLCLVERAVRSDRSGRYGYGLLSGVCVGMMLLEQQDVGLFAGLFLGSYTLIRLVQVAGKRLLPWVELLVPICVVGFLLAAPSALQAYKQNVTDTGIQEDSKHQWEFVTQWSMVPSEVLDLIVPGYTGWSTGNPDFPYWGAVGQSAEWKESKSGFRNFRLDSLYIGIVPVLLAGAGMWIAFLRRKSNKPVDVVFIYWGVLALIALMLSMGKYSLLYEGFYHFPLMGNIRAPIKFLHNFQVIIGILAAYGLDRFIFSRIDTEKGVLKWMIWICGGVAVFMAVASIATKLPFIERSFSEWGTQVPAIISGICHALMRTSAVSALLCVLFIIIEKKYNQSTQPSWVAVVLLGLLAWDSIYLTGHYFQAENVAELKAGNPVMNYLKEHQENDRVYCFSQQGVYNLWISVDFLYHGIHGFNFGQMPRMPSDYKAYLSSVGRDWHRLLQLSSCRLSLAPAPIYAQIMNDKVNAKQIKPVMGFRFIQGDERVSTELLSSITQPSDQVLFECTDVLPRVALFEYWKSVNDAESCSLLSSTTFNPEKTLLISDSESIHASSAPAPVKYKEVKAQVGKSSVKAQVDSERGGILQFVQYYQDGWSAWIDGKKQPLLRCNYICMGVYVPSGKHQVEFKSPQKPEAVTAQIVTLLFSVLVSWLLLRKRVNRKVVL